MQSIAEASLPKALTATASPSPAALANFATEATATLPYPASTAPCTTAAFSSAPFSSASSAKPAQAAAEACPAFPPDQSTAAAGAPTQSTAALPQSDRWLIGSWPAPENLNPKSKICYAYITAEYLSFCNP